LFNQFLLAEAIASHTPAHFTAIGIEFQTIQAAVSATCAHSLVSWAHLNVSSAIFALLAKDFKNFALLAILAVSPRSHHNQAKETRLPHILPTYHQIFDDASVESD